MTKIDGNATIKNSKGNISGYSQYFPKDNYLINNTLNYIMPVSKGRFDTDLFTVF
jgi:hypothetical protein